MNSAPNSQPIRQTRRHWRERPSEKMRVNSGGSSKYSATTFTPPSEMSVTMQSRGKPPVPNWILARLLQIRRSLLRRFANISITPFVAHAFQHHRGSTKQSLGYAERKLAQSIIYFRTHFIDWMDATKSGAARAAAATAPSAPKPGVDLPWCAASHFARARPS